MNQRARDRKQEGTPNPLPPEQSRLIRYPELEVFSPLRKILHPVADDIRTINPMPRAFVGVFRTHKTKCDSFENRFSSKKKVPHWEYGTLPRRRRGEFLSYVF